MACSDGEQRAPERLPASAGTSGTAQPSSAPRSVKGTWAIVAGDMDATVVELDESGNGHGCQAGWANASSADYAEDFCGSVTGYVDGVNGDHVVFDLALTGFGGMHYSIDGTLSEQGDRIGGIHRVATERDDFEQPGAAIRYDRNVEPGPYPFGEPWPSGAQGFVHDQVITQTAQGPFQVGRRYWLKSAWTTLGGDLGEYLGNEISIDAPTPDDLTFHAGPVSSTTPDRPIGLNARYVSSALIEVVVEMPSGETFTLIPAPPEP